MVTPSPHPPQKPHVDTMRDRWGVGRPSTYKSHESPRKNGRQLKLLSNLSRHLGSELQNHWSKRQSSTWRTQALVDHRWQLSRMLMFFTPTPNPQSLKEVGSKGSCGRRRSAHAIPSKARLCSLRLAGSVVWETHSSVTTLVSSRTLSDRVATND
jgi:hypothetical protein